MVFWVSRFSRVTPREPEASTGLNISGGPMRLAARVTSISSSAT